MDPEVRCQLVEGLDAHLRSAFEGWDPDAQDRFLDWRLFVVENEAATEALTKRDEWDSLPPEIKTFVEHAVKMLAEREYPIVWVGMEGITVEDLLAMQEANEELPEWLRVEPGETVFPEGAEGVGGVTVPGPGVRYLDAHTVLDEFADHLSDQALSSLEAEVTHIRAAKSGMVVVVTDSLERCEAGLPPTWRTVHVDKLTPEDVDEKLLEDLVFYIDDTFGPYVMRDSERARRAVEERLGSGEA